MEELAASRLTLEFDRTLAAFDGPTIVATGGIFTYQMTVPGGVLPCGGVTRISVLPTHRRRGLLTAIMRRQLDDMHRRGEPLAALYASEAAIYGRFGYGLATYQAEIEIQRSRGSFRRPPAGSGQVSLVDADVAAEAFTSIWERVRPRQPGMLRLDQRWWRYLMTDVGLARSVATPQYRVVYEADGAPQGFALYRFKVDWLSDQPDGMLTLESLIAVTPDAYAALWRYLLDVDLMSRVVASHRPVDEPLRFLLQDSREPKTSIFDGIWLRLVDVAGALAGRRYGVDGTLALEVRDDFCPWNSGRYQLTGGPDGAECARRDVAPDLIIDAADLAAAYLGGNQLRTLLNAGRLREEHSGAVGRADAMFATDRAPWCPSHF
jgi:predicted acetyltransferase